MGKLRAGKGKMRNRRYVGRKGPLLVHAGAEQLPRAMRNLPGVDLCHVDRLNLLLLAPGSHCGRFVVWTSDGFAALKKDYVLPRACMENADLARLINSDEIQSVVRAAEEDTQRPKAPKKNPLKNLEAMLALNPPAGRARQRAEGPEVEEAQVRQAGQGAAGGVDGVLQPGARRGRGDPVI